MGQRAASLGSPYAHGVTWPEEAITAQSGCGVCALFVFPAVARANVFSTRRGSECRRKSQSLARPPPASNPWSPVAATEVDELFQHTKNAVDLHLQCNETVSARCDLLRICERKKCCAASGGINKRPICVKLCWRMRSMLEFASEWRIGFNDSARACLVNFCCFSSTLPARLVHLIKNARCRKERFLRRVNCWRPRWNAERVGRVENRVGRRAKSERSALTRRAYATGTTLVFCGAAAATGFIARRSSSLTVPFIVFLRTIFIY